MKTFIARIARIFRHGQPDELIPTDPSIRWLGWVNGTEEDIPKLRAFGFTGEMKFEKEAQFGPYISHVNATTEVMERACEEWPYFNWRSFTGVDADGNQLPFEKQIYAARRYPFEGVK